jgi:hypothetical protein
MREHPTLYIIVSSVLPVLGVLIFVATWYMGLGRRRATAVRVLINYAIYADRIAIHCLADDARTVIGPFKCVSNLETLCRLMKYVGGDPEQCRREIKDRGHGGCWAAMKPEHFDLLGIKKTPQSLGTKSGRSAAE